VNRLVKPTPWLQSPLALPATFESSGKRRGSSGDVSSHGGDDEDDGDDEDEGDEEEDALTDTGRWDDSDGETTT